MKKWKKPVIVEMTAEYLSKYIKVAANSCWARYMR